MVKLIYMHTFYKVIIMLGVLINCGLIILGGIIGVLFRSHIKESLTDMLMTAMGLVVMVIGISNAAGVSDMLALVLSLAIGSIIGHLLKIGDFIDGVGDRVNVLFKNTRLGGSTFGEGFVTASIVFGVGTMAIMGSIEAGINNDYSILITKGVLDLVTGIAFSAAFGIGVSFSAITIFIWQGAITLLAATAAPYLGEEVIADMSAVGGAIFIGMGINMLKISDKKINVNNLIPAIIIPIIYVPVYNWLTGLF